MKKTYGIVWDIYAQTGNEKIFFDWARRSKWATLIILLTTFCNVYGQSPKWIDLVAGQWEIDAPEGLFDSGDTIEYTLLLGDVNSPMNNLIAIELQLDLADYASPPSPFYLDTTGSWMFEGTELDYSIDYTANLGRLDIIAERQDGSSASGDGKAFNFRLICSRNNIEAADLILDDGGIILVENIELKTASGNSQTTEWGGKEIQPSGIVKMEACKIDLTGKLAVVGEWDTDGKDGPGLKGLSPGLYVIFETFADGKVRSRKIAVD